MQENVLKSSLHSSQQLQFIKDIDITFNKVVVNHVVEELDLADPLANKNVFNMSPE